jgi:hypothetical protein
MGFRACPLPRPTNIALGACVIEYGVPRVIRLPNCATCAGQQKNGTVSPDKSSTTKQVASLGFRARPCAMPTHAVTWVPNYVSRPPNSIASPEFPELRSPELRV